MVPIDSAESTEQARFAIELFAIGGLNLVGFVDGQPRPRQDGFVAFLLRRSAWGWWLVLGMQVGVFVLALIEGVLTDIGWFYFSSLPLLSLFLLLAFRKQDARLKPSLQGNPTAYLTR